MRFTLAAMVFLVIMGLSMGCATPSPTATKDRVGTDKRTKMIRTQVEDQVTLQWNSEPRVVYGVLYTQNAKIRESWKILPGFESIQGTGKKLQVTFSAPLSGKVYYRLLESDRNR